MPSAETLVDQISTVVRTHLPPGVTAADLDGFLARNRAALVALVDQQLAARAGRPRAGSSSSAEAPPDLWSAGQRTSANLAAMRIAASKRPADLTDDDRRSLAAYSGWGGLSLEGAAKQLPAGFPAPARAPRAHPRVLNPHQGRARGRPRRPPARRRPPPRAGRRPRARAQRRHRGRSVNAGVAAWAVVGRWRRGPVDQLADWARRYAAGVRSAADNPYLSRWVPRISAGFTALIQTRNASTNGPMRSWRQRRRSAPARPAS